MASTVNLFAYALLSDEDGDAGAKKEGKPAALDLVKTIDRPELPGDDAGGSFRAVR